MKQNLNPFICLFIDLDWCPPSQDIFVGLLSWKGGTFHLLPTMEWFLILFPIFIGSPCLGELHNLALQLDEEISSTVEDIFRFWEVPEFPRQPPPKEWVPKNPEVILPVDEETDLYDS